MSETTVDLPAMMNFSQVPNGSAEEREKLYELMQTLYDANLAEQPDDRYLTQHRQQVYVAGQIRLFQWYHNYFPATGTLLDWGCRHAPDSCLVRATAGERFPIRHACDLPEPGRYGAFHDFAGVEYRQLSHPIELPYESEQFDVVLASGVIEHVAMDYESLKELYRVMKVGGRLVITYLPNRWSWFEYRDRRNDRIAHRRLYSLRLIEELLLRTGFVTVTKGYQTKLDALAPESFKDKTTRFLLRPFQVHRVLASCLCLIAEKVDCM